ncbi:MAG: DUF5989 family protein, partial [Planctomycetota bacterium]
LRLLGLGPAVTLNRFNNVTGWSKKPKLDVHRKHPDGTFKVHFVTNEMAQRDDPMKTSAKPEGVFRVLAVGDSFTLGFGVQREDLFVDLLEDRWNAEGRKIEVVNIGTEGWSTDQEAAWLEARAAEWNPDLVLLFPYENDIYWNSQEAYIGGKQKPRYSLAGRLEKRSLQEVDNKTWKSRYALTHWLEEQPDASAHIFRPEGASRPILKEFAPLLNAAPDFLADCELRTKAALGAAREACASAGAELIVCPIPSHAAIDPEYAPETAKRALGGLSPTRWSADRPVDFFLDACSELGIATIDSRERLRSRLSADTPLYWTQDWHFDPSGNRAFAEILYGELEGRGVFPEDYARPESVAAATTEDWKQPAGSRGPKGDGWKRLAMLFGGLWVLLSTMYCLTYEDDRVLGPLKVGALLATIFGIVYGLQTLLGSVPPQIGQILMLLFVAGILGFVIYKLGNRVGTIAELFKSFTLRGHWYLMPLVVVLLSIGSLLVVAASSPLVAPFIYTLF